MTIHIELYAQRIENVLLSIEWDLPFIPRQDELFDFDGFDFKIIDKGDFLSDDEVRDVITDYGYHVQYVSWAKKVYGHREGEIYETDLILSLKGE